ncbi:hypothetical protein MRX96_032239 [Rhipicephalus microplus]
MLHFICRENHFAWRSDPFQHGSGVGKRAARRTTSEVKPQPAAEQAARLSLPHLASQRREMRERDVFHRARGFARHEGVRPTRLIRPRDRKRLYHLHPTVPAV